MSQSNENSRAMRVKEAAAHLGIKTSTFWRWCQQGKLPRGIRLSARCTVWKKETLDQFLNQATEGGK
jgi:excisionase family DNA binding protein